MRFLRILGALGLAGGALLAQAPAASAATPTGAWLSPAPAGTQDDVPVAYLESPQPLKGYAEFDQGIAGVAFTLVKDAANANDPCAATPDVKPQSAPGGDDRVEFAFDAPFPCNRRYQVRATVAPAQKPLRRDTPLVLNLWVAVAIPPAPTTGLGADVAKDRTVTVRWDAVDHEADFQGYEVRRSLGSGFERIAEVPPGATTYADHEVPAEGGTVRYQVVGMRPAPDPGSTVYADAGPTATASVPPVPGASDSSDGANGGNGTPRVPKVAGGGAVLPSGSGQQSAHRTFKAPKAPKSTTPTTADTGYQETLPFGQRQAAASGDDAAVARLDEDGDDNQRQTLLMVAGATTTFSWAMALRFLTKKAAVGL